MTALADDAGADPDLVETWVKGWALARGTPPPIRAGGAYRVDVGWPRQKARHVFPRMSEDVRLLAEATVDPWVYIKVCAPAGSVRSHLPPRWMIQPASFLMMQEGPPASGGPLPAGYRSAPIAEDAARVAVLAANGDLAASGHLAVVGDVVIYDRIETHPDHRRRGLGRAVMAALSDFGRARGAEKGLLVATEVGRALYQSLGWRVLSPYTSAVIPSRDG